MVARIKRTQSLSRSLNYNEKKVQLGVAECIQAVNYPKDLEVLNFYDKLHRLQHQAALNERVKANSVHISLNFHESDKLDTEKLCSIAESYMKDIGFENQPYLVYRHDDAAHPHIHIVSTNIQKDGSKIEMQNIGRNQSERARKNIEEQYHLIKAEGRKMNQANELKIPAQKIHYGKSQTKRAITNVLEEVINNYKYASLPELNAVLKLYNVVADRGLKDSKMYAQKRLIYSVLDDNGKKIGVPIKASEFYNKPTLRNLEKKFSENENLKEAFSRKLQMTIKWVLVKKEQTINEFTQSLAREGIKLVPRQSNEGKIYGLTYIDLKNKCVFNGSDLGKEFSAQGVLEKLKLQPQIQQLIFSPRAKNNPHDEMFKPSKNKQEQYIDNNQTNVLNNALYLLFKQEQNYNLTPHVLTKKKRKKQKKKLNL